MSTKIRNEVKRALGMPVPAEIVEATEPKKAAAAGADKK